MQEFQSWLTPLTLSTGEEAELSVSAGGAAYPNQGEDFVSLCRKAVDKSYILKEKKENFGISCLTNEKQYYIENYPEVVVESGSLDQVILMLTGGER